MRPISSAAEYNARKLSSFKNPCRRPMKACETTSNTEPVAIFDESREIGLRHVRRSLCNIRGYCDCSAAHLVRKTEPLVSGKMSRVIENRIGEIDRLLPDI
jgi:hypothetical protein